MLLSKIGKPYDPQAGTGVVGRNWTYQIGGAGATGWYEDKILNRFMGSGANGYNMDEFNADNFDHSGLGFFGGGNISCSNTRRATDPVKSDHCRRARQPGAAAGRPPSSSTTTASFRSACRANVAAYRQNYADLDPTYRDAFGDPLLRITFNFTDNERNMVK